ncbi:hypothetical protein TrVFT333_006915 [Trichoderma virens FT-333]|nr:hypothetical protein TrVFT333_006915 [Trichoderma virens FT-333]
MSTNDETGGIPDHPFLDNPSFWSPYAASDILNLAANEGPEYDGPLRLLLIGAFGLRHLIYSFVAMPETANPLLYVTINEFSKPDIMRTFLSLLILSEEEADDLEAAEAVIHVWYSVKWSKQTQSYIDKRVRRLLAGIYTKVQSYYGDDEDMRAECFAVKFGTPGYLTLDAFFDWHTWDYVLETYFADEDVEIMNREADVLACGEAFDRIRRTMSPSRAAALMKWRLDGILVPYGQSSSSYTKPNPYLHDVKHFGLRVPGDDKSQQPVASIMITGYLGLSAKHLNTIVNQWPNVLVRGEDGNLTKEAWRRWMSWPANKPQCWLEWKKTRDVSPKEWFKYLEMSTRDEESVRMWKRTYGYLSWEQRTRNKVKEEAEMTQRIVRTKMPKKHDNEASDGNDADGEESSDVACQAEQTHISHDDVEGNDDGELETTLHDGEMKNEKNQDLTE